MDSKVIKEAIDFAADPKTRAAFVSQIDSYIKQTNKYKGNESKITFSDVEECLVLVISSFSSRF